jgi:hypothetical protein
MSRGYIFYNLGRAYIARMIVAIHSLRKFYNGPITIFNSGDEGVELLSPLSEVDKNIDVKAIKFGTPKGASTPFLEKANLHEYTPYYTSIFYDSDVLFIQSVNDLFDAADKHGFVMTSIVPLDGEPAWRKLAAPRLWERLYKNWVGIFPEDIVKRALEEVPWSSSGVVAFKKESGLAMRWYEKSLQGRNNKYCEQVCMNIMAVAEAHAVMDTSYNWVCKHPLHKDVKVIHYFKSKHCVPNGKGGWHLNGDLWVKEFKEIMEIDTGFAPALAAAAKFDPAIKHAKLLEK